MNNILEKVEKFQLDNRFKFGMKQMRSHIGYKHNMYILHEYDKETATIKIDVVPPEYFGTIGSRIKDLRQQHKLSQKELSKKTGITQATISLYEQDKVKPSVDSLILLADTLFTTIDYIVIGIW